MFKLINFLYFVFFVCGCDINKGGSIEKMSTPQLLHTSPYKRKLKKKRAIRIYERERREYIYKDHTNSKRV